MASDQIMVCLSSHGPNSEKLLRYGSRLAGRLNRNWYAVYVQTPSEEAKVIDARTQRLLSESLTLAKQLGAMVFTYKGEGIVDTLLHFAREYRVGHIVVGRSRPKPFWKKFGKNKAVVDDLMKEARGITIIVLDTFEDLPFPVDGGQTEPTEAAAPSVAGPGIQERYLLGRWLSARRILIWTRPVSKKEVLRSLAAMAQNEEGTVDVDNLFNDIMKREEQGSTFFNEGVAFPHVRVDGLRSPVISIGLTREGVTDVATDKPIEIVFLILSPLHEPDTQVKLLAQASRAAQNRLLLQRLRSLGTPDEMLLAIENWERPEEPRGNRAQ